MRQVYRFSWVRVPQALLLALALYGITYGSREMLSLFFPHAAPRQVNSVYEVWHSLPLSLDIPVPFSLSLSPPAPPSSAHISALLLHFPSFYHVIFFSSDKECGRSSSHCFSCVGLAQARKSTGEVMCSRH